MQPLMQLRQPVPTHPFATHETTYGYAGQAQLPSGQAGSQYAPQNVHRPVFPSQSLQPLTTLSQQYVYNQQREHLLRRKTPRGTIDDGYDGYHGSAAHMAGNPPALKHTILSRDGQTYPSAALNATGLSNWAGAQAQPAYVAAAPQYGPGYSAFQQALPARPAAQNGPMYSFRQLAEQNNFYPGLYTSDPMWSQAHNTRLMTPRQMPSTGYVPHNVPYDGSHGAIQAPLPFGGLGSQPYAQSHPFRMPTANNSLDDGYSRSSYASSHHSLSPLNNNLDALSLEPSALELSTAARFKERALAQAHQSYADLVAFLNHAKKAQAGKAPAGSKQASRMVMFPRPPKQKFPTTGHIPQRVSSDFTAQSSGYGSSTLPTNVDLGGPHSVHHHGFLPVGSTQLSGSTHPGHGFGQSLHSPIVNAESSIDLIMQLCRQSEWKWIDGMMLGGCLHYGLERYESALDLFRKIVTIDPSHVEAISNMAASLYCLQRHDDAEQQWMRAIKIRPAYLEAVEHLVGLLCARLRSKEAVDTINYVQRCLRVDRYDEPMLGQKKKGIGTHESHDSVLDPYNTATHAPRVHETTGLHLRADQIDGCGSSGYAIPGNENGRMLLLVHAKGNMLYAMKRVDLAAKAFEEAVMISAGRQFDSIQSVIRGVHRVLGPETGRSVTSTLAASLLLPPDQAKTTAHLVFEATHGHLPGLCFLPASSHRRSAIATTSNALLSLAKIYQDAMALGTTVPGLGQQPAMGSVGDILALYYLSLSLQESPSTANNVGILLASVQTTSPPTAAPEATSQPTLRGIVPNSGLALALAYYSYGLRLDPKHVHLHTNLGSLLKDIGQLDLAIQMYERAVACDNTFDIALTNLANAVKDRGRIADAIFYYRKAVESNPNFAEAVCGLSTALNSVCDWRGRGGVFISDGRYDRWHVDDEGMLSDVRVLNEASGVTKKVTDIVARQLTEAATWGARVLSDDEVERLGRQLALCTTREDEYAYALKAELDQWQGKPWEGSRVLRLVERATRSAMSQWYQDKYVHGKERPEAYARVRLPKGLTVPAAPTVLPFHAFTCPLTARDVRRISQRNALRISCSTLRSSWLPDAVYPPPAPPKPCLNIGYISSDFLNHPLAHLMQSVFGFHDPKRAKAFCYATTPSDKSVHRQQIEREAPVFRDVSSWPPDKFIQQIVDDGIHILVNLNGYTRGARNEIFAARPAPIQMSFMGFAGTLGAEWCDYLVADATAIPRSTLRPWRSNLTLTDVFRDKAEGDEQDWVYSENIIFCRDTFFCCDHKQTAEAGERNVTWEEEQVRRWKMRKEIFPQLSDDTVILANFNQLYKIDPTTFRTWLRILANTPKAILWLLRFPDLGEAHLTRTAKLWAGEAVASRIIFTDVAPKAQHIARARVCDLFLDTPVCNSHTTATDVLWSSTPLLTLPLTEYKLCSRMAASILKGALPSGDEGEKMEEELIVSDEMGYEKRAVELANGLSYEMATRASSPRPFSTPPNQPATPLDNSTNSNADRGTEPVQYGIGHGRLAEMRRHLFDSKWTCPLFDTKRWVRDLEDAYEEAWRRWVDREDGDIWL